MVPSPVAVVIWRIFLLRTSPTAKISTPRFTKVLCCACAPSWWSRWSPRWAFYRWHWIPGPGPRCNDPWRLWLSVALCPRRCWHWSWCHVSMICLRGIRVWWRKRSKKTVDKPRVPSYDKNSKKQRLWERGVHINSLQRGKFTGWKTSQRKICGR